MSAHGDVMSVDGEIGQSERRMRHRAGSGDPPEPVDAELYGQLCEITMLPNPPEFIRCRLYF